MILRINPKSYLPLLAIVPLASCSEQTADARKKPNVIFIYADDLGKGMLSAFGQQQFTTPNIDALVRNGLSFSNAYGCMLSAPARASLLTGYSDCRTDKWIVPTGGAFASNDTSVIAAKEQRLDAADVRLPKGDPYLAQVFQKAGYSTAQVGKLDWGFTSTRRQMRDHGWDYYYGYLDHIRCHGFYPPFLFNNGKIEMIEGNTLANCGKSIEPESDGAYNERWDRTGKKQYSQDLFLEKILQYIRDHKDEPFFLYHPTQLPHGPVSIPSIHPELAGNPNLNSIEKEYASMVKMLDDNVGAIVAELEKLGIAENTIVIFSADNGHELYYSLKGRVEKPYRNMQTGNLFDDYEDKYYSDLAGDRFNGNAGMAGLKRSNLDGGVHIPLIYYWKGHITGGTECSELVSNYDFLSTMAEMLGVELTVPKDGISYLSMLKDPKAKFPEDRAVFYASFIGPAMVTNNGSKIRNFSPKGLYEIYNLRSDPQERKSLLTIDPK